MIGLFGGKAMPFASWLTDAANWADSGLSPAAVDRIREEQIATLRRYAPATLAASICNAIVCAIAFWQFIGPLPATLWLSAIAAVLGPVAYRQMQKRGRRSRRAHTVIRSATRICFLQGCCWAAVPLFFFTTAQGELQLLIACVTAGMLCGGILTLSIIPSAALAYGAPIAFGSLVAIGRLPGGSGLFVQCLFVSYAGLLGFCVYISYQQLKTRIQKQIEHEESLRRDDTTRLPNTMAFQEKLATVLENALRRDGNVVLISVHLSGLDVAREKFDGRVAGRALVLAKERLQACITGSVMLAHTGDDVFRIILPDNLPSTVDGLADTITDQFSAPFIIGECRVNLPVSIGIAEAPRDGADVASLVRNSDIALHEAKRNGHGAVEFFAARIDQMALDRRLLAADLKRAIAAGDLGLAFQPIWQLSDGKMIAAEALVRWHHPVLGQMSPMDFIPVAEETGLINDLGIWVLRNAIGSAAGWPAETYLSVNVSPVQLEKPEFAETVLDILQSTGFPPKRLAIEITETALLDDETLALRSLRRLREQGVTVSLDDFGTGYSSLNYIRQYPLDCIKIDRSFVNDLLDDRGCAAIVRGVLRMAADLGVQIVAEGVETKEQLDWLTSHGCGNVQGFLISRPVSADEVLALMWGHADPPVVAELQT